MIEFAPFMVPIVGMVCIATVVIFRGPMGKALADRIAGGQVHDGGSADTESLHGEIDDLKFRLSEVEERLDFTERLLARHGEQNDLPGGQQ